jgi:hypothetical protein
MKFRSRKDLAKVLKKQQLMNNPNTKSGLAVSLRAGRSARFGYMSALNRQQKKVKDQLRGLPGCGTRVKDWDVPWA